jgi:hypothetical protein
MEPVARVQDDTDTERASPGRLQERKIRRTIVDAIHRRRRRQWRVNNPAAAAAAAAAADATRAAARVVTTQRK